jgi:hypothetical protein
MLTHYFLTFISLLFLEKNFGKIWQPVLSIHGVYEVGNGGSTGDFYKYISLKTNLLMKIGCSSHNCP